MISISPMCESWCARLLRYVTVDRGGKIFLTSDEYKKLWRDASLTRAQVEAAVQALFAARRILVRRAGATMVIEAVAYDERNPNG